MDRDRESSARWMNSVTEVMGALWGDLKEQINNRWKKCTVCGHHELTMTHNPEITFFLSNHFLDLRRLEVDLQGDNDVKIMIKI